MDNLILPEKITNSIFNDIYKEIMSYNPRSWFEVNKQLHATAEKLYYSQPEVIHEITHGRSLLHIIASNSLRGLSLVLPLYSGTTTLEAYGYMKDGEKVDVKYNLLKFIWNPTCGSYCDRSWNSEADPFLKRITRKRRTADIVRFYRLFLGLFPQERILVDDVLKFMEKFIDFSCSSMDVKSIFMYMDTFLSNPVVRLVVANNIRKLLKLATSHKYMFEYLIKCEFVTSEDKSVVVTGNANMQGIVTAIKDLSYTEAVNILKGFHNNRHAHPNVIKAILRDHPFPDLASVNKEVDREENDVTMRDKFWSLSMDVELATILNTRFPVKNRLSYYTGASLATANYLLKLDLQDDSNYIINNMKGYLLDGNIIYKALIQNEITKAELIKNHHKYMLHLLNANRLRCKVIIAIAELLPTKELDPSYLDIVYISRTKNEFKKLVPHLNKKLTKSAFIALRGKHHEQIKKYNIEIVPALTEIEKALFS